MVSKIVQEIFMSHNAKNKILGYCRESWIGWARLQVQVYDSAAGCGERDLMLT